MNKPLIEHTIDRMRSQVGEVSAKRIVLTCSGGRDSMVLVHLFVHHLPALHSRGCVLHINHDLDEQAAVRADLCQQFAHNNKLHCEVVKVKVSKHDLGPEAAARHALSLIHI